MKYCLISIYPSGWGYILSRGTSRHKAYKMRDTFTTPEGIAYRTQEGITYKVVPVHVAMGKRLIGKEYL